MHGDDPGSFPMSLGSLAEFHDDIELVVATRHAAQPGHVLDGGCGIIGMIEADQALIVEELVERQNFVDDQLTVQVGPVARRLATGRAVASETMPAAPVRVRLPGEIGAATLIIGVKIRRDL
jgi:hypothetical protein